MTPLAAGVFALQQPPQPNGSLREITEQELRLPAIDGMIIRLHCADVLKSKGFDLSWLDKQVGRARRAGKKYGLLLMSDGVEKPWLTSYASKYNKITEKLGDTYDDCAAWFPGGAISPPGSSEEPHWKNPMPSQCVTAFKNQINIALASFSPKTSILWPISVKDKSGGIRACAEYLAEEAGERAMIGHNALKLKDKPPQTPTQWLDTPHNRLVVELAKKFNVGVEFEMVSPTVENHRGSTFPRCGTRNINECIAQAKKLAERAGAEALHVRVYPQDLPKVKSV